MTPASAAAQANLPWPPQPPQWSSQDTCQQTLQSQLTDLLQTVDTGTPADISSALQGLIDNFNSGPSEFVMTGQYVTGVPGTYNTSYIDSTAQGLIDQINAALSTWQTNQTTNWNIALNQTHTRDALGRITQTQETLLAQAAPTKHYTYDSAGRLTSATAGTATTTWGYDANGNRTTENGATIATYDNQDRLLTWRNNTYQYNAAGDLSSKTTPSGTSNYTYDAQGNLRQVLLPGNHTITYAIDPLNRRTGKTVDGKLQWQLVWMDNMRPLARLKGDNTLDQTYYYGDKPNVPEAMTTSDGKTYRIVSDQNGSVRLVIDGATGAVAQEMEYDTWGNVINDTNPGFQPFGFAGGIYDPDTGLTRFGARDYDAEAGRWTAKDPILFGGGDSNLYGYVLQDPVNGMDPSGLFCISSQLRDAIDTGVGTTAGALASGVPWPTALGVGAVAGAMNYAGGNVVGGAFAGLIQGAVTGRSVGAALSGAAGGGIGGIAGDTTGAVVGAAVSQILAPTSSLSRTGQLNPNSWSAFGGPAMKGMWGSLVSGLVSWGTSSGIDWINQEFGDCGCGK